MLTSTIMSRSDQAKFRRTIENLNIVHGNRNTVIRKEQPAGSGRAVQFKLHAAARFSMLRKLEEHLDRPCMLIRSRSVARPLLALKPARKKVI